MADEIATAGKWYDTKEGKVVDSQPEEGIQLLAEGSPIPRDFEHTVAQYETATDSEPVEAKADTGGGPSKTVSTSSVKGAKSS